MRVYVDSDILIWHLRGERKAFNFLKKLKSDPGYELWIGAMQRAEIVFFMRPQEEEATVLFLSQFKTAAIDQIIVDKAALFYREWNPSHGTDINDALLAGTVIHTGGTIFSLNYKHYPMSEVNVRKAW
ncbi:MAG: PIN domain-containing protein [Caldithrix sp.]|nr:MAG: PIN domain-containing protein [Caldithrix sp.]